MTCIVGIEEEGRVILGADSAGVAGYSIRRRSDSKLFRAGDLIGGFTGSFRMGQVLRNHLKVPKGMRPERDLGDICRDLFREHGCLAEKDGVAAGTCFLFGWKGRLYEMESDFQVGRIMEGFNAVGCGDDLALGAMFAAPDLVAKERVRCALKAAARFSAGVVGPFRFIEGAAKCMISTLLKES